MKNKYTPIIGLEVHVELKTKSKMFCSCSADYFGKTPNTHTCPVCLGLPGALPVPNKTAIEWCIMIALALNCRINNFSKFDRKNYFYPDLPKGYQISQYDIPFGKNGWIEVASPVILGSEATPESKKDAGSPTSMTKKRIGITRVHMEEDTGKLTHLSHPELVSGSRDEKMLNQVEDPGRVQHDKVTLIDFNRSGVPLVEIVTEPDFNNEFEVMQYLQSLKQIVRYLDVSNADMEKGDMRLEPNISLQKTMSSRGDEVDERSLGDFSPKARNDKILPSYKVEVKNINSFRFVDRAIKYEIKRQQELLDKGDTPVQETRGWNEAKQKTVSQRVKEEAQDYRYFPEPDIPPIQLTQTQISNLKSQMPELPDAKLLRFKQTYGLSDYDGEILTRERSLADYFEESVRVGRKHNVSPKQIANILINKKVDTDKILPAHLIKMIVESTKKDEISKEELTKIIEQVLTENEKAVTDFKNGKRASLMFLVGQVMRKALKKLNAEMVKNEILRIIDMR